MLTFLKLGGSLITDKRQTAHFQPAVMRRAAGEIRAALATVPGLQLLLGHGSGSFGHVAASKYGTMDGVKTAADWRGFADVATTARALNALVMETLHAAGLPVWGIQPSASARCNDTVLDNLELAPIQAALDHELIPVIYGDVALDSVRGGTILSTEALFFYLAERLHPARILLLGETEGVYDKSGAVIPWITPENFEAIADTLGSSHGTDVTGGMINKVQTMLALAERRPGLQIVIAGGAAGQVEAALLGQPLGTVIVCKSESWKTSRL